MLRDLSAASDLKHVILRYFNVAGSDPDGRIGQSTRNATLLIKVAAEVAVGKRDRLFVFGTDYPTRDGTGVRDYIHVTDLADAHVRALDYLRAGGTSTVLNCGYGHGYSVREVIDAVHRVLGRPIAVEERPRRPGDPPQLVAAVDRLHATFQWTPRFDDLDFIVRTSLDWERKLMAHPGGDGLSSQGLDPVPLRLELGETGAQFLKARLLLGDQGLGRPLLKPGVAELGFEPGEFPGQALDVLVQAGQLGAFVDQAGHGDQHFQGADQGDRGLRGLVAGLQPTEAPHPGQPFHVVPVVL